MLARLFVLVGGLVVLALSAALVAPYFIDWTGYRADFEREASAILGRPVAVRGDAEARLLPFPSVTFSDVVIGGGEAGDPVMTVETFSMDAELAPFLSGEFLIFDMRLVRPKATIAVAADGMVDWILRPSAPVAAHSIAIERLTVTEGQISVRDGAGKRDYLLTEINTQISARSLDGPWRVDGTLRLDGRPVNLFLSTGARAPDGTMRLRVRAEPSPHPVLIEADGSVRLTNGALRYDGQFRMSERRGSGEAMPAAMPAVPGPRVSGRFALDHRRLAIEEFLLETGPLDDPYSAHGTGFVEFGENPRFSLSADGAQVRFDAAGESGKGIAFAERLRMVEDALLALPEPGIPGTVEVNLPAIVAGDTTIRDVHLSARPVRAGWTIERFTAALPGRATIEASGSLDNARALSFSGSLLLAVGQPSGFAAWLARDVDDAIRRLPAAGFRADVELNERVQSFRNLELVLGAATFRGEAESCQPVGARPSATLKLEGGALDIDGLAAFASLFVDQTGTARLAGRDVDLMLKAGPVAVAGLTAGAVDTALRLREGSVEVDRLAVDDLAGATISATGKISGLPDDPAGNLDATVMAGDLQPLVAALAQGYPDNFLVQALDRRAAAHDGLLSDARIDVLATAVDNGGGSTGAAFSAHGTFGGTQFAATFSGSGTPGSPEQARLSLSASGRNEDAAALLALYGLPTLPLGLLDAGETDISLEGTPGELKTSAGLRSGDFSATFEGVAALVDGKASARGHARLSAPDIEPWLMTMAVALPGFGVGTSLDLAADIDFSDSLLVLSGLEGTVNEGVVSGDLNVAFTDAAPALAGELALDLLDLEPWVETVLGAPALHGEQPGWPGTAFRQETSPPVTANIGFTAATLALGVFDEASEVTGSLSLSREGLRLADLAGAYHGGRIGGMVELRNSGGTGLLSGQVRLHEVDIDRLLGDTGLSGRADMSVSLSASGKSLSAMAAALSGSGTAAAPALVVKGLNAGAFSDIIARADTIGRDIDADGTAAFAPQIASSGSFVAAPVEAAFTIAGGVVRVPPVRLETDGATADASLQADLTTGEVSIAGAITYDPGREALVGSEPSVAFTVAGPMGDLRRHLDTGPLAQFLTQRALEIEQARVEGMQSALLERQRLRREARYYAALQDERSREAERLRLEEERRRREAEERARLEVEQQARLEAQERAAQKAAEEQVRRTLERPAAPPAPPQDAPVLPPRPTGDNPSPRAEDGPARPLSLDGFFRSLPQ